MSTGGDSTQSEAIQLAADLDAIARILRQSVWSEARRLPLALTPAQVGLLKVLVDAIRSDDRPPQLSISELSTRLGLAHSTVSGIVTRLEGLNLVTRVESPDDRRFAQITLTGPVSDWVRDQLPALRTEPLSGALEQATLDERRTIVAGLATLRGLLERTRAPGD